MKRVSLWMIGIGLFVTVGLITVKQGYAEKEEHATTCSVETLQGTYVFAATGYNIVASVPQPIAIVESIDFDGEGMLKSLATLSVNGTIIQHIVGGGSYTVAEDCTGTVTFNVVGTPGVHLDIFVAPNGKEFYLIQTDTNAVLAGVARRVTRE